MATKTERQPPVTVKQADDQEPVGAEIIAQSIVKIDEAMQRINASGLKRNALVILIQSHSKVSRREIESVLTSLDQLKRFYTTK